MKKKKLVAVIIAIVVLALAVLGICYFFVFGKSNDNKNYKQITENMQCWQASDTSGLLLYVPEGYSQTENEFYKLYCKDDARIKFTFEEVESDLANYSKNAIDQYKSITDLFDIKSEYDEVLSPDTIAHVVEFNYSLSLDSGIKSFSCLSAFVLTEKKAYVLTCTCDGGNYEKYKEDFYKTYKTMRVVKE